MGIFVQMAFNSGLDGSLAALELPSGVRQALDAERVKLGGAQVPRRRRRWSW